MKVTALIGSNRGNKSTSASLIRYLEKQLKPYGIPVSYFYARSMYSNEEKGEEFIRELQDLTGDDLLIVCASNYVDSLPAPLINLFERVRDSLGRDGLAGKKFMAVVHSGFPEQQQRKPCLDICRLFTRTMGMQWCGGISIGGTSPIAGQPLEAAGPFAKKILPVLDRTAGGIASGSLGETEELFLEDLSAIPIPRRMVPVMMNVITKIKAVKEKQDLRSKPYAQR